jgi:TonB family protein
MMTLLLLALAFLQSPPSAVDQSVYRPGDGVTSPRLIRSVPPRYTADALRLRKEGVVLVEGIVEIDGSVTTTHVLQSLDTGLDAEALRAFQQWQFTPGTKDGKAVRVQITTQMAFRAPNAAASVVVFRRVDPDGSATVFEITGDRFRQLLPWDPDVSPVPALSPADAIRAATSWLERNNPRPEAKRYLLLGAAFLRFADRTSDRWYYQVNFAPVVSDSVVAMGLVTVVVLFDGTVVEPKR